MAEKRESLDHLAAAFLNGAVITLLGAAFPAFLIWSAVTQWRGLTDGLGSMSGEQFFQGGALLLWGVIVLRAGLRMLGRAFDDLRSRSG